MTRRTYIRKTAHLERYRCAADLGAFIADRPDTYVLAFARNDRGGLLRCDRHVNARNELCANLLGRGYSHATIARVTGLNRHSCRMARKHGKDGTPFRKGDIYGHQ